MTTTRPDRTDAETSHAAERRFEPMTLTAFRRPSRGGKVAAKDRIEDHHGDEIAEDPEASRDRQLGEYRHWRDQENGQADGIRQD